MQKHSQDHVRGILIVVAGVLLISFDALLVRLAGVDGWNVSFWRGLFMALAMAPFCAGKLLRSGQSLKDKKGVMLAALMMACSSLALVLAFTLTQAANAVVILSAAPLFAALLSRWFLQERCPPRTWLAIVVCMAGVLWVMRGSIGGGDLTGDLLALVATLFVGGYFTVFRRYPQMFFHAQVREYQAALRHQANTEPGNPEGGQPQQRVPVKFKAIRGALDEPHNAAHGGGLAHAIASKQGHHLAGANLQIDTEQRLAGAIPAPQGFDLKHPG